jgi:tetratricopeptide (TPR) repeat protein
VLDDLPETTSPTDRYLLGYHLLRAGKSKEAMAQLDDVEVRRIPHAEELFIGMTRFEGLPVMEQRRLAVERYGDLVRVEERLGARTATTAHIAALLLGMQDRHDEALRACEDGVALAPRAYVLRINAGYCAMVQGRIDEAREHLAVARDLRPNSSHVVEKLLWLEIAEGHSDAALELVRVSGPQLVPSDSGWVDYWSGVVAAYAALDAHVAGNEAEQSRQVEVARTCFERVPNRVLDKNRNPQDTAYRIAKSLEAHDPMSLFLVLAELMTNEPNSWWRLRLLLRNMPKELDPSATKALMHLLESLDTRTK